MQRDVYKEIRSDFLQFLAEGGAVTGGWNLESGGGFEECFTRHRGATALGGKFFHVHSLPSEDARDLTDNARAVLADDLE